MPTLFRGGDKRAGVVRAAEAAAGPHPPRAEAGLRPRRRLQPRPPVSGAVHDAHADARRLDMRDYYARRAPQYERIYPKPERQADLRAMEAWLPTAFRRPARARDRLRHRLVDTASAHATARRWLATDLNPETMAVAQHQGLAGGRCASPASTPTAWPNSAAQTFDAAFAGFWWSHVPLARLPAVAGDCCTRGCEPARASCILDNRFVAGSSTPISAPRRRRQHLPDSAALDDGSTHEVLKNFPQPRAGLCRAGPARARRRSGSNYGHYWLLQLHAALTGSMQTNLSPRIQGHARRRRGRGDPAQVRALRLLHRHLPDLPAARRRARRPARPHLPDEAGARRRGGHAQHAAAPGPLPDLPQLREHLPERRASTATWSTSAASIVDERVERPAGEKALRWLLKEGPDLAAVRAGDEARPAGAPAAAGGAEGQGAGAPPARAPAVADARAPAQGADAAGLRAAGDDAEHQLGHRARARRRRHPDPGRRRRRLLRRDPHATWATTTAAWPTCAATSTPGGRWSRADLAGKVEAIVMNASGCGVTVKEYGHALAHDPALRRQGARASAS